MIKAILVDIDNTLVNASEVFKKVIDKPKEEQFSYFYEHIADCPVIEWCVKMVKLLEEEFYNIVFLTGRSEVCREETEKQLKRLGFSDYSLVMRPADDITTKDEDMKRILLRDLVKKYDFDFAIDDRWQNCKVFTEEFGIPSLVVYYPVNERY